MKKLAGIFFYVFLFSGLGLLLIHKFCISPLPIGTPPPFIVGFPFFVLLCVCPVSFIMFLRFLFD